MARIKPPTPPAAPSANPAPPKAKAKLSALCPQCQKAFAAKTSPDGYCMGCEQRLVKTITILKSYGYDIKR